VETRGPGSDREAEGIERCAGLLECMEAVMVVDRKLKRMCYGVERTRKQGREL